MWRTFVLAAALSLSAGPAAAQGIVPQPAPPQPPPRHTGFKAMLVELGKDMKELPSHENFVWAGVGSGLALAAHPFDDRVNRGATGSDVARDVFEPGKYMGELPALLGSAVAVYAVGRLEDEPRVSHTGMDLIRALAISEGLTQALKYATRRERPDHTSRNSFPSGHAADTFAIATALERHANWRLFVPAYVFSSYVALSRLPENRHWLSDVVFGSTVGIIAGRTVTGHETASYPLAVTAVPGGVAVTFVRREPPKPHRSCRAGCPAAGEFW
ncbi:MAG: phosphatase PAP2 family protein [Betaproteobacteria bacterium]